MGKYGLKYRMNAKKKLEMCEKKLSQTLFSNLNVNLKSSGTEGVTRQLIVQ